MDETAVFVDNYSQEYNNVRFRNKSRIHQEMENFSYEEFKWNINIICQTIFRIVYFCCSILQFLAIWSALVYIFHNNNITLMLLSLVLGFLPVVGTVLGMYCASVAWSLSLVDSISVFIIPYFIANAPLHMVTIFDIYKDYRCWQKENI